MPFQNFMFSNNRGFGTRPPPMPGGGSAGGIGAFFNPMRPAGNPGGMTPQQMQQAALAQAGRFGQSMGGLSPSPTAMSNPSFMSSSSFFPDQTAAQRQAMNQQVMSQNQMPGMQSLNLQPLGQPQPPSQQLMAHQQALNQMSSGQPQQRSLQDLLAQNQQAMSQQSFGQPQPASQQDLMAQQQAQQQALNQASFGQPQPVNQQDLIAQQQAMAQQSFGQGVNQAPSAPMSGVLPSQGANPFGGPSFDSGPGGKGAVMGGAMFGQPSYGAQSNYSAPFGSLF